MEGPALPTLCEIEVRVRYPECDPMGYVHHARYFEYFERGRTELLRLSGKTHRDFEEEGVFFVVARAECKFMRPARYDEQLRLRTMMQRTTPARIDHVYELHRGSELLCLARTTLACVGPQGRLRAVPERFLT